MSLLNSVFSVSVQLITVKRITALSG